MAKKNRKGISIPRLVTPIALAIILAACTATDQTPLNLDITSAPNKSAQTYLLQADVSQGSLQTDMLIMSLKAANKEGNSQQASRLIKRLENQPLTELQQAEWQLASAQHFLSQQRPELALAQLNFPQWWELSSMQWQRYHQLKAKTLALTGDYFSASDELITLSSYLPEDKHAGLANQIWGNLSRYSKYQIGALSADTGNDTLAGWLQLATISKTLDGNLSQLKGALENWLLVNKTHPAAIYLPADIQAILALEITRPKNTALLLPLTGKFKNQAATVRDGYLLAMMNDSGKSEDASLTIIDTNGLDQSQLSAKLAEQPIDFIVGPLTKSKISELQAIQAEQPEKTPILALNFPEAIEPSQDVCYLTLSPEQEAQQAAKHLFSQGYQFPLILAPKGSLGERMTKAFTEAWQRYSRNPAEISYFGSRQQLQKDINAVLGLTASQKRIAQMDQILSLGLESQPRSRRDIDAIYLLASSAEITLIKPFIEVAINPEAKSPQLFSNSRSNTGVRRQFEDLSGIIYSDIPLLMEPTGPLMTQMETLWPEQKYSQKRLMALGMDAYKLSNELPQMKLAPSYQVQGNTGLLTLDNQCIIQREINWAQHEAL